MILTKEDIESLGFTTVKVFKSPYTNKELYNFTLTKEIGFNTGTKYFLQLNDNSIKIATRTYGSYDNFEYSMEFFINTKEELIILLKQIGLKE